jgi:hypothetical protein
VNNYDALGFCDFLAMLSDYLRQKSAIGDFFVRKQGIKVFTIQVMEKDPMPVVRELLDRGFRNRMVEAVAIRMGEND